jgi:hypothetical protein
MSLASSIIAIGDGTLPASFEGLKSHLGIDWIEDALSRSGVATVRKRKLTSDQVVWLVVGMALYRDRPIPEVVSRLDLVLPETDGRKGLVSKGAIPQARNRVGVEPLRELFATTARHWAVESADNHRWRGLTVLGIDGTRLRVPDSEDNRESFHLPGSARRSSGYPQIQAVGLMVLRSHLLLDFDFDHCRRGELSLAQPMLAKVPAQSLVIMDRGFVSHGLFQRLHSVENQRHWLSRSTARLQWRVMRKLGPGDDLVEVFVGRTARQNNPELPASYLARAIRYRRKGFKPCILLTSLLDPSRYPAVEIVELYHERWELELGYDEIKTHTLERLEALRSRTPEGLRQEVWGLAVAYNLIRREMEAVAAQLKIPPRRISFRMSLVLVRDLFVWAATASPGSLPKMIEGMRLDFKRLILPERRSQRSYPRHVKIKMSSYARNDSHPLN